VSRSRKCLLVAALPLIVAALAACGSGSSGPSLTHCPRWPPEISGGESPGEEGEAVSDEPLSAIVCRWRGNEQNQTERDEKVVRGPALTGLVAALNSLPPGEEGVFNCPSGTLLKYLVGLRYSEASEVEVEAEFHSCDIARTEEHYWGASEELRERLDALLGS
jgi:hypothetical protein